MSSLEVNDPGDQFPGKNDQSGTHEDSVETKDISGWTVVNPQGEVDTGDESSSISSLEFVQLDDDGGAVSFGRHQCSLSPSSLDIPPAPASNSSSQNSPDEEDTLSVVDGKVCEGSPDLVEDRLEEDEEDMEREEDVYSDTSVEVLSCSPPHHDLSLPPAALHIPPLIHHEEFQGKEIEQPQGISISQHVSLSDSSSSSLELLHHPESGSSLDGEDSPPEILEHPSSDIDNPEEEVLDLREEREEEGDVEEVFEYEDEEQEEELEGAVGGYLPVEQPHQFAIHPAILRQHSESDSDSDFLRLDHLPVDADDVDLSLPESVQDLPPSRSSIGSNFRFVHPPHGRHDAYHFDDDDASIPSDVDDRCESDISGIAVDESDLSSMTMGLADIPLTAGVKHYCHKPNPTLNATLTTFALVALILGVGIGIGHYLGTTEDDLLHEMQVAQMKTLQDDYLLCLRKEDHLKDQLAAMATEEDKWAAVTSIWKQKYEELAMQKVELEQQLLELEKVRSSGLSQVHELATDAQKLEVENSQLQQSLSWQAQRAADLENKMTVLTENRKELQASLDSIQKERDLLFIEREQDKENLEQLKLEQEEEKKNIEQLKLQQEEDKKKVEQLTRELENASNKITETQRELNATHENITSLMTRQTELRLQLNQARVENDDLKSAVARGRYSQHPANKPVSMQNLGQEEEHEEKETLRPSKVGPPSLEKTKTSACEEDPLEVDSTTRIINNHESAITDSPSERDNLIVLGPAEENTLEHVQKDLDRVNRELAYERSRSDLWESLFTAERAERLKLESTSPNVFTCMQVLLPEVGLSDFSRVIMSLLTTNTSAVFQRNMAFFQNLTADVDFCALLHAKWEAFQRYTKKSDLKRYAEQARKVYGEIELAISQKWQDFHHFSDDDGLYSTLNSAKSGFANIVDNVVNITKSNKLHDVVNQTMETVSRLNNQLQDTWQKVKNLSSDFLKQPQETINQVHGKLSEKLENIASTVHSHWKKVKNKFDKNAAMKHHKHKHGDRGHHRHHHHDHHYTHHTEHEQRHWHHHQHHLHHHQHHHQQHLYHHHHAHHMKPNNQGKQYSHSQFGSSTRRPYNNNAQQEDFQNFFTNEHGKRQFEDKPNHKQRQSNHENEKYEEFWKQAEYDPNDFMHEGFFEGNNREWRKHQKTLKKLHGRINRLNEDILHSMDDDDIEDIYEDLEDFQDDLEDEIQPEKLKTWLTCQLRWWKSRFQRKHRSNNLVDGCGRQLMHWQLRALCQPGCVNGKCRLDRSLSTFCLKFTQTGPYCHGRRCSKHQNKNQGFHTDSINSKQSSFQSKDRSNKKSSHAPKNPAASDVHTQETVNSSYFELLGSDRADWYFQRAQDRADHLVNSEWYFRRADQREDRHHDPMWYLRSMAQNSNQANDEYSWVWEYNDQKSEWVFRRAEDRAFERNKPWYLHRAEQREYQHKVQEADDWKLE